MSKLSTEARNKMPEGKYAFPKEKKEPLENAAHVRNAIARFNQVEGVSETEKDAAWKRIKTAAKKFGVEMTEDSRSELKNKPTKKAGAKKAVKKTATKKTAAKRGQQTKRRAETGKAGLKTALQA